MSCYPELTEEVFIAQFPEFETSENIEIFISRALNYFSPFMEICCEKYQYIVFLLTAHFLTLQGNIKNGDTSGGLQTGASIDKVSVSVAPPPFSDGFEYYLNQTTYGQQLLALLNLLIATPQYIGGSFQRVL